MGAMAPAVAPLRVSDREVAARQDEQQRPTSRVSGMRVAEYAYVVVLLGALTLGPVTYAWTNWLRADPVEVADAVNWTLVALQLPAVALLARRLRTPHAGVLWALGALVAWMSMSVLWSAVPEFTVEAATSLIATCCVGAYLARSFRWGELTVLVFLAMQPGLVLSRVAIARWWPGVGWPTAPAGVAGVYGNRNSLGPPAVMAAAAGVVLIAMLLSRRSRLPARAAAAAAVFAVVLFDLDLQRRGDSTTSWLMLVAFLGTTVLVMVAHEVPGFTRTRELGVVVGRVILAACVVAFLVAVPLHEQVSQALDRPVGFTGRVEYWDANIAGVRERPIFGWGWMAAWRAEEFRAGLSPHLATDVWSHSSYLDIALGGGLVAVALGLAVAVCGSRSAGLVARRGDVASTVPLALVVSIGVGSTEESFLVGNYFLFALMVAALCASIRPQTTAHDERRAIQRVVPSADP